MNDNAKKWVEELESGKHKQTTRGVMKDKYGVCCLYVAVMLYEKENNMSFDKHILPLGLISIFESVRVWLGLKTQAGEYLSVSLAHDNDENGKTFKEIAAIIRSEPEGLFND